MHSCWVCTSQPSYLLNDIEISCSDDQYHTQAPRNSQNHTSIISQGLFCPAITTNFFQLTQQGRVDWWFCYTVKAINRRSDGWRVCALLMRPRHPTWAASVSVAGVGCGSLDLYLKNNPTLLERIITMDQEGPIYSYRDTCRLELFPSESPKSKKFS